MLDHSSSVEILTVLIETFRRYLDLWASMNVAKTIMNALHMAHIQCKARGMHSRALLSLMVEMDNGRCMDPALRKTIEAEISAFAQV
jgi:mediator of RNA polymerase II transcription subunit 12, fungi type